MNQKEICPGCEKVVYGGINPERMVALNETWHKRCFKCVECGKRLNLGDYLDHDGDPYCVPCHKELYTYTNYPKKETAGSKRREKTRKAKEAPPLVEEKEESGPPPVPVQREQPRAHAEEEEEEERFVDLLQKTFAAAGRELKSLVDNNILSLFSSKS